LYSLQIAVIVFVIPYCWLNAIIISAFLPRPSLTVVSHTHAARITVKLAAICVVFRSWQQSLPYCYARVIQETCNTSSADISVLKTAVYDAKLSGVINRACALGELPVFGKIAQHTATAATYFPRVTRTFIWLRWW